MLRNIYMIKIEIPVIEIECQGNDQNIKSTHKEYESLHPKCSCLFSAFQNRGKRMIEGAHINRSLLALGNCINALSRCFYFKKAYYH